MHPGDEKGRASQIAKGQRGGKQAKTGLAFSHQEFFSIQSDSMRGWEFIQKPEAAQSL